MSRLFGGTVRVRVTGGSLARFLNLCAFAGIGIERVVWREEACFFTVGVRDFFRCRPYAKKAGVRLKIVKKSGLSFFLYRNRRRKLWAAGLVSFLFLLWFFTLFLWDISFEGNRRYTDDELAHFLQSRGIVCGIRKSRVSCSGLEEEIREAFDGITWVSARLSGTRLTVSVRENEAPPFVPDTEGDEAPGDLVAEADAVITSVVVRRGLALVKAGDAVTAGQLLVTGTVPIRDDAGQTAGERYVRADADVIGIRTRVEKKEFSLWHRVGTPTGRVRRGLALTAGTLGFVWLWPAKDGEWQTEVRYRRLKLPSGASLPLAAGSVVSREISSYEARYTQEELLALAEDFKRQTAEKFVEKGVHIIENNVKILVDGPVCRLEACLKTEEPVQTAARQTARDGMTPGK